MSLFSRCETAQGFGPEIRPASSSPRRGGAPASPGGLRQALFGFAEDIGILFRYAAGLDYYGRHGRGVGTPR